MPRRPTNYPPQMPKRPKDPIDAFVFDFGFPGVPAGFKMRDGLLKLAEQIWNNAAREALDTNWVESEEMPENPYTKRIEEIRNG